MATGTIKSEQIVVETVTKTCNWSTGTNGQTFGTYTKAGYTLIAVSPVAFARASTTSFSFVVNANGSIYMTTTSGYAETGASITLRLIWMKN